MESRSTELDRFLRAVHRRWVVVRVAEATGVGVAVGCGPALLLLPIFLWWGEPALPVVLAAAAIAASAGMTAGVIRRPNLASAAAEADRQLDLSDLLSTALVTRHQTAGDPWAAVVVATASARCRTLSPSAVIVNRFGGRAWGGIGLATALVLTLGLMSADPKPSAAVMRGSDDNAIAQDVTSTRAMRERTRDTNTAQTARRTSIDAADRANERDEVLDGTTAQADVQPSRASSANENGGGAGLATSSRPRSAMPLQRTGATGSRNEASGEPSAGGTSAPASRIGGTDAPTAGTSAASSHSTRTPAWRSSAWPTARDEALSAVRDGAVRGEYRDLVREYFDRTSE